ncbi:hypothetical protein BRADI_1g32230v3 [Brachypodium distachyon]|uniref:BTB domain-containing protein n=1 Tax=Brachypodium distachyon TaxID=15368 RepID=A0A0Q3NHX2_BRADI|nr:hypothetical protein BRADI_1g32230v3 [Brachypodium distachyon]
MANACAKLTGVASSVRQLRIDGFSLASSTMESQEYIKSRCDVDGYEWEIRCYPATSSFGKWVELNLVLLSEALAPSSIVRASLACRLLHPVPQGRNRPMHSSSRVSLVDRSYLPVPASRADDYLAVQCTITVLKELPDDAATASSVPVPASDMHRHFGEPLRTVTGAHVTFLVSGESFMAHKNILAARSPVFMAEFFGNMKEACLRRVEIEDMEAAAFRAMLHFIYTDSVPELDQELGAVATMAQHLLAAADRYGLDRLKLICEGKLAGGIAVDTAATTLALAEQHNCLHLKAKCVEFIVSTPAILDGVLATDGYKHLEASCPSVLTGLLKSVRGRKN